MDTLRVWYIANTFLDDLYYDVEKKFNPHRGSYD